jgi:ABC-type uncharacterized transport system substrate-binding protein
MRVDIRWEASDGEHARKMAAELVALSPDVILSSGVTGLTALQKIHHIPVVFAVAPDPRIVPSSPAGPRILRRQF